MSWSDFEEIEKHEATVIEQNFEELCALGTKLFTSMEGVRFIELLKDRYLNMPVSPFNGTERYACEREGQNGLVRMLDLMPKIHEQYQLGTIKKEHNDE